MGIKLFQKRGAAAVKFHKCFLNPVCRGKNFSTWQNTLKLIDSDAGFHMSGKKVMKSEH